MRIIFQLSVTGTDDMKRNFTDTTMSLRIPQNTARAWITNGRRPCYQECPHSGLVRWVKIFGNLTISRNKVHVSSYTRTVLSWVPGGTCGINGMSLGYIYATTSHLNFAQHEDFIQLFHSYGLWRPAVWQTFTLNVGKFLFCYKPLLHNE